MTLVNTETGEIESPVLNYEIHPVADLFPFIEGDAFREFVEDIRANGQREPVVLDADGRLLDGRNRARACQALGIDVKETRYSGDDVEAWIISHNVHRRHLTDSQRAMIAAKLANLPRGGDRRSTDFKPSSEGLNESVVTRAQARALLDVSEGSIHRAKIIAKNAIPEVVGLADSGALPLAAGARVAELEDDLQHEFIDRVRNGERPERASVEVAKKAADQEPLTTRVDQIRALAEKGATSAHIAKEIGISEERIRRLARENGVLIVADEVRGRVRRLNHDAIIANAVEAVEVASMALRDIDPSQINNKDEALNGLDSLTKSITALTKAIKTIKESLHD